MRVLPVVSLLLGLAVGARAEAPAAPAAQPLSDVLKARRPSNSEFMGLYLLGKKIGYMSSELSFAPGTKDRVRSVEEYAFKLGVGNKIAERKLKNVRVYEARPGGRLLSFTVEHSGDGGDQLLEGTATPTGMTVVRKRPNQPNQVLTFPAAQEKVEDADQARVAIYRNQTVEGVIVDATDLGQYKVTTRVRPSEEKTLNGVKVKLSKVETISEKEKVATEVSVTEQGEMVEIRFGDNMVARSEPESVAKRLDQAEVFGLTRVELPSPLPAGVRGVPGSVKLVMTGLPERFWKDTYRQKFKKLPDGKVEVTLLATPPKLAKAMVRPLADPNGGANLKSTLVVEADNPEIQQTARKIIGNERNAYLAAKKIVDWVGANMVKDYGSSADRASDVLHQMRGDCTEHALLSVALLRAVGIPAKRVDGVVYLVNEDNVPALYWHEWVEAYVGEWTQLDPTFGQTVADATHFGVGEEGNAEIVPLIGQMKVLEVR